MVRGDYLVALKAIMVVIYRLRSAFVCTLVGRDGALVAGQNIRIASGWFASALVCSLVVRDGKLVGSRRQSCGGSCEGRAFLQTPTGTLTAIYKCPSALVARRTISTSFKITIPLEADIEANFRDV